MPLYLHKPCSDCPNPPFSDLAWTLGLIPSHDLCYVMWRFRAQEIAGFYLHRVGFQCDGHHSVTSAYVYLFRVDLFHLGHKLATIYLQVKTISF